CRHRCRNGQPASGRRAFARHPQPRPVRRRARGAGCWCEGRSHPLRLVAGRSRAPGPRGLGPRRKGILPMIRAGAAIIDITPTPGLPMSGFAARTQPAEGVHDGLTVRAVVIGETAIVVADVIGIDAAMSARIRKRCALPAENIVVAALHTHGGPVSMAGRLSVAADLTYLERLEDACVA